MPGEILQIQLIHVLQPQFLEIGERIAACLSSALTSSE
jgi:hypothetical protein